MLKMNRVLFGLVAILLLSVSAHSDDRSFWQKFVDFFSPAPAVTCEGSVCDELRNLDSKIGKVEGRYSRERRPVHKERLKKELDSLQVVRDSLWTIVEAKQGTANTIVPVDTAKTGDKASSKSAEIASVETAPVKSEVCAHDTVFVHDTVVVHDTLYVMLANKPEPVAPVAPESSAASSAESAASAK
ncbi:MAG: hypothetical protein MJZ05_10115 [Fibrobacter sp.]|nr:hypothetical protein [Fibrobacter sp.]